MADEPLPLLPHEEPLPPRTDLWIAAGFFVLRAAILVLGWRMPTYADQGGQIYTAPGLVPSFYGVVIGLLSLWLGARALRAGALITYEVDARVHHPVKIPAPTRSARVAQRHRERGAGALYVKHGLPLWVIVRGLIAPVVRPMLKGRFGSDLAQGWAMSMGRLDGLIGWKRRQQ